MLRGNMLIVDDHTLVRRGLKELLQEQPYGSACRFDEAANLEEARRLLRSDDYVLILLDISLPDGNGLELLQEIRLKWRSLPVLIISMYGEQHFALQAFNNGATGYITKESAAVELCTAVERVIEGGRYISPRFSELLLNNVQEQPLKQRPLHEQLSSRERQVADLLVTGKAIKCISYELGLHEKTVSTYRSRLLEKLQLHSNCELMAYYIKYGLKEL